MCKGQSAKRTGEARQRLHLRSDFAYMFAVAFGWLPGVLDWLMGRLGGTDTTPAAAIQVSERALHCSASAWEWPSGYKPLSVVTQSFTITRP